MRLPNQCIVPVFLSLLCSKQNVHGEIYKTADDNEENMNEDSSDGAIFETSTGFTLFLFSFHNVAQGNVKLH